MAELDVPTLIARWTRIREQTDLPEEVRRDAADILTALERAERLEAAARLAYEFLAQEDYECRARTELRAALAPAPGPAAEEEA